ncbi:hypothetical protein DC498_20895 [Terrimonas sp.]|uniref:hypothetical protein n=1 Tax=Terrimonas sp. TaxID=1914338 RepID=UPI000D50A60E|nr:hypothetical protein [Terrimonas sp.]PVD50302.1 hypothetical protein DC498_20895 [Terrimonas sp.]
MTKRKPILTFIIYIILGLISESIIFFLFPFTGLGGIICYPLCIALSIAFGWTLFKMTKKEVAKGYIFLSFLCFLTVQSYLELKIHPQDFGGSPISQIGNFKKALANYDKIKFEDFGNLTKAEKVIYNFKYKDGQVAKKYFDTLYRQKQCDECL